MTGVQTCALPICDGGAAPQDEQAKFVGNESHQVEEAKLSKKVVDKKATVD